MAHKSLMAIIFVLCFAVYALPADSADNAHRLFLSGSEESQVVIEVFSDFQCPACGYFFKNVTTQVLENYKDRVGVAYYEFPLRTHKHARPASRYVTAVGRLGDQKKLVAVCDAIFANQDKLEENGGLEASVFAVLSPEDLLKVKTMIVDDLDSIDRDIESGMLEGIERKIRGTPAIFLKSTGKLDEFIMPQDGREWYKLLSMRLDALLKKQ